MLWLDVHWANLTAVLAGVQICPSSIVRVIETKACWPRGEYDSAFTVCGNERRTFFSCPVDLNRNHLAMPMQLLRRIGVVVDIHCDLPPLFESQQWTRKLPVIWDFRFSSQQPHTI